MRRTASGAFFGARRRFVFCLLFVCFSPGETGTHRTRRTRRQEESRKGKAAGRVYLIVACLKYVFDLPPLISHLCIYDLSNTDQDGNNIDHSCFCSDERSLLSSHAGRWDDLQNYYCCCVRSFSILWEILLEVFKALEGCQTGRFLQHYRRLY